VTGPIAAAEHHLMLSAVLLMLIVVIPVFAMTSIFPRVFRVSNTKAQYRPEWSSSRVIDAFIWLIPALIVCVIGRMVWTSTHQLDPYRHDASYGSTIEVDVIAEDWKWLFLYPEQGIATVNELVFPTGSQLHLKLTSDASMSSFLVPELAGQIYVMAGMQTELHLSMPQESRLEGRNTQFNGAGFDDQHFAVQSIRPEGFEAWVAGVRARDSPLDAAAYATLVKRSSRNPVTYYSSFDRSLFDSVIEKYMRAPAPVLKE
jgi:cytochrome o ubiquinol oxidase subunit II